MKRFALLLSLGLVPLAHAQERGAYMGGAFGTFDYEERTEFPISDDTYAYQVFGGYRFNDHFALEGGLGRTGEIEGEFVEVLPAPFGPVTFEVDAVYDIYSFRVVGMLPFEALSLVASAGYYSASFSGDVSVAGVGEVGFVDGHERGATGMLGIQRDFSLDLRSLSIRGQYEWFDFGSEIDASGISVGMLYRF